jgi:hypothetical protein
MSDYRITGFQDPAQFLKSLQDANI